MIKKHLILIATIITIGILIVILSYMLINGLKFAIEDEDGIVKFLFTAPKKAGKEGGISTIIVNTILMIVLTLIFCVPIGLGASIYMSEYAEKKTLVTAIKFSIDTLASIPSIIFGLFGFIFFSNYLKFGIGLLSGSLTLSIMVLPTIIKTAVEAINAVPNAYREGSLALGATKWDTIKGVVLPSALPGIFAGITLGIGRIVGETAALTFTMGTDYRLADSLFSSARVLSTHLYLLTKEGISLERAFATADVLIIIVLIINIVSNWLIKKGTVVND